MKTEREQMWKETVFLAQKRMTVLHARAMYMRIYVYVQVKIINAFGPKVFLSEA